MDKTKLYILDNGYESLDKNFLLTGSNVALTTDKNPEFKWQDIPIQAFLIKDEGKNILFDTGCDPDFKENWPPFIEQQSPYFVDEEQVFLNQLAKTGVKPEKIDYVVQSHLHVDHAGNLHQFKNSEIFVNENEFLQTLKGYATGKDLDVHVPSDIKNFIEAKLTWHLLPNETKEYNLTSNVKIINLGPGHAFGMLALLVKLKNFGNVILPADAIYLKENIDPEIRVPGILYDSIGYRKSIKRLLEVASKENAKFLFGHDIEQFRTLKKTPEFYD